MLFPSCRRILLFPLLSSPLGPNKVLLDPSCTWIRCTRVSSWYSNGPFNSDLVETFKTNAFNAFVLDRVIGPFGTCNGSLLVFLGWSTSPFLPDMIHYSCETQFTRKIDESFAMPSDSGPSNPFIPAFYHSWNVASVTNIPSDHFSIGAFK
jgi:hypothetical protein